MMKLKICICILLGILLIIFTPYIFHELPVLTNLFTDNINYILIMLVVIFVMLIDVCFGTTLALVILYMAMYINTNIIPKNASNNLTIPPIKNIIKVPMTELPNSIKITPNTNVDSFKHKTSNQTNNNIRDDSEFIYDNTKPFPNKNLKPFQPIDYVPEPTQSNQDSSVNNDMITKVEQPDRSGFDITGCIYDMKNSPQNLTRYGPPVAQCSAYDPAKVQICGTVFYPLNA